MRTLAIGDIHGAHKALLQALNRADFNPGKDRLISLGDVSDGLPETAACVETLLEIPNHIAIRGNHDSWTLKWLRDGWTHPGWLSQGGKETIESYTKDGKVGDRRHRAFFEQQVNYFVDEDNRLYVHGGFDLHSPIEIQGERILCWNRSLWKAAMTMQEMGDIGPENPYHEIYIGHTPTVYFFDHTEPVRLHNICNLDQGVKAGGPLTIMDVETHEYWQSDRADRLYR